MSVRHPHAVALAPLLVAAGCYTPPEGLYQPSADDRVPVLSSDEQAVVCSPNRTIKVGCGVDGDTFDIGDCGGDAERVRMLGVDAPETAKPGKPSECGADLAAAELDRILSGRVVELRFDRDCEGVFGRTLAYVELEADDARLLLGPDDVEEVQDIEQDDAEDDPIFLNTWMLWTGLARRYDEEWVEPLRFEPTLIAAERIARSQGRGVWGSCQ